MTDQLQLHVASPPPKPLMLFDGDCHFCRRWIERWKEATAGTVDYVTSQEAGSRFPEISRKEFERAVQLIDPNGQVCSGAEAVFRALAYRKGRSSWLVLYRDVSGFAAVADALYGFVSQHRTLASGVTRLLWGSDVRQPTYFAARRWFLRALALVYLIAFLSLWAQVDGLIGRGGILPVGEFLHAARNQLGGAAPFALPTLCWLNSSNGFLHFLCGAGAILSLLLLVEVAPVLILAALFVFYLSLTIAGQTFLSFQWDILLLETGFLAIFLAPLQWWPRRKRTPPVSRIGILLLKLLLFKLMLMSAVVKLTSGDNSWWDLTALNYHYETQPLPTALAWFAHHSASWMKQASTLGMYFVELVAPFVIWAPRRLRLAGAALLFLLQASIALTGNYGFFNLLTAAFCLLLIDDVAWPASLRERGEPRPPSSPESYPTFVGAVGVVVLLVTLPLNATLLVTAFKPEMQWPRPLGLAYSCIEPFRIVNGYGLFRVMTKSRPEIVIEGSADGVTWLTYQFKWKPDSPATRPRWVAPYQPRLDWQMWFAALDSYNGNPWFVAFAEALLRNRPEVTALLASNPFGAAAPKYLRATLYDYRFTTKAERAQSGAWWHRELQGEYLPVISLGSFEQ